MKPSGVDRADVDQELARDARMRQRNDAFFDSDFPEHSDVLFFQRSAAAFQVLENAIEFFAGEIAKGISATDQIENLIRADGRDRGQSHDVLRDDVVRLFLDLDRIERAFADQFRGHGRLDQIVDVRRDEDAVAAAIERMTGAPDSLDRARDTPFGVATITTRSTAPISIPISRLVEQTTARSSPFFSRSSTSSRTLRSSDA